MGPTLDMLKFQTNEIDAAQLQPDEESKLIEERAKLSNFQRINQPCKLVAPFYLVRKATR